jgi:hypothetical protein
MENVTNLLVLQLSHAIIIIMSSEKQAGGKLTHITRNVKYSKRINA